MVKFNESYAVIVIPSESSPQVRIFVESKIFYYGEYL